MKPTTNHLAVAAAVSVLAAATIAPTHAQDADAAAEMARKLQDPLANISAIMTDNGIDFDTGTGDDLSYGFQIQPVKAFSFDDYGFNFIARAIIPISGVADEAQRPIFGEPVATGGDLVWGLSDISVQTFISPKSDSAWKWGVGPMFSLRTRTDERLAGPGWGAGPVGVLVGGFGDNTSFAVVGGHLWGQQDGFSLSFVQPMMFYNPPALPGVAVGYNNTLSYNWNASGGNEWTVPVGLSIGKTFDMGGGHGLDLNIGPYWNVVRPDGAADFVLKFGVTWIFP